MSLPVRIFVFGVAAMFFALALWVAVLGEGVLASVPFGIGCFIAFAGVLSIVEDRRAAVFVRVPLIPHMALPGAPLSLKLQLQCPFCRQTFHIFGEAWQRQRHAVRQCPKCAAQVISKFKASRFFAILLLVLITGGVATYLVGGLGFVATVFAAPSLPTLWSTYLDVPS